MAAHYLNSLQHPLLPKLLCSLAILKWKIIGQLNVEIDSTAHPAIAVGVESEVTMPNCIVGFWGLEVPHCTNDLCPPFFRRAFILR